LKTTYTPVLKKRNTIDHYGIINIRVTKERNSKYYSTGIRLPEDLWNSNHNEIRNNKNRITEEEREKHIKTIESKISELKGLYSDKENIIEIKLNDKKSFLSSLLEEISFLENRKKIGTSKRYKTSYFHLKGYLTSINKSNLLFSDIDSPFIRDFETYLIIKNIKNNTTKNYINCIKRLFNQCVKSGIYLPLLDPFILFKNHRQPVIKKRLIKIQFEKIISSEIPPTNPLFNIKNYFLFQVYAQGLRVSDLITLRFENYKNGRLEFTQWKTKKPHSIYANENMLWILKDYIPHDFTLDFGDNTFLSINSILNRKYTIKIHEEKFVMNYNEFKLKYTKVKKECIKGKLNPEFYKEINFKLIEVWKEQFDKIRDEVIMCIGIVFSHYSKLNKQNFIFPILKNEDFTDIGFNQSTLLSKYQYNQLQSKTTIYNKRLKDLQEVCELDVVLTSHISRHTYTNLMLEEKYDIYEISKSLGHTRLSTTEHYINDFSKDRVDDSNIELNKLFSFQ
jgi:site-specific recombinase XerD